MRGGISSACCAVVDDIQGRKGFVIVVVLGGTYNINSSSCFHRAKPSNHCNKSCAEVVLVTLLVVIVLVMQWVAHMDSNHTKPNRAATWTKSKGKVGAVMVVVGVVVDDDTARRIDLLLGSMVQFHQPILGRRTATRSKEKWPILWLDSEPYVAATLDCIDVL